MRTLPHPLRARPHPVVHERAAWVGLCVGFARQRPVASQPAESGPPRWDRELARPAGDTSRTSSQERSERGDDPGYPRREPAEKEMLPRDIESCYPSTVNNPSLPCGKSAILQPRGGLRAGVRAFEQARLREAFCASAIRPARRETSGTGHPPRVGRFVWPPAGRPRSGGETITLVLDRRAKCPLSDGPLREQHEGLGRRASSGIPDRAAAGRRADLCSLRSRPCADQPTWWRGARARSPPHGLEYLGQNLNRGTDYLGQLAYARSNDVLLGACLSSLPAADRCLDAAPVFMARRRPHERAHARCRGFPGDPAERHADRDHTVREAKYRRAMGRLSGGQQTRP